MVNYINKQLSLHDFVSFRSDFLNDKKGRNPRNIREPERKTV